MITWEYALLVRRRVPRMHETGWELTYTWYGPDGQVLDVTPYGDTALAHLNRAGSQGWELASVTEDTSMQGSSELHRYHMKRSRTTGGPPRQRIRSSPRAVRRN
ncbi:hypothetical protein [Polymorphospora rubra]|nr:hypothetical protein [Polymorphospora rubra]